MLYEVITGPHDAREEPQAVGRGGACEGDEEDQREEKAHRLVLARGEVQRKGRGLDPREKAHHRRRNRGLRRGERQIGERKYAGHRHEFGRREPERKRDHSPGAKRVITSYSIHYTKLYDG